MPSWRSIVLVVAALAPMSCTYGDYAYATATTITSLPRRRPRDRLEFFFGDEKPKSPYLQVALIEAVGGPYTTDEELLVRLKHRAALSGADAVVGIRKGSKTRERGDLFCKNCKHTYGATVFSGTAVIYLDVPAADSARPDSARPDSARPDSARPDSARPDRRSST